jgi:hypothetical protein
MTDLLELPVTTLDGEATTLGALARAAAERLPRAVRQVCGQRHGGVPRKLVLCCRWRSRAQASPTPGWVGVIVTRSDTVGRRSRLPNEMAFTWTQQTR